MASVGATAVRPPSGPLPSPRSTLSISAMKRSVSFCTSVCARRSSSSATSLSFSSFFRCSFASRRTLRTATRASSASWRTTLISSLRRSSVSAGIGTRIRSPRRRRIEAEVGIADRLLDHRDHLLLPRLHGDRARVGERDVGDLVDRHRRAVVVDLDVIEQPGVRAAGADLAEVGLQRLDRLLPSSARRLS